MSKPLAVSLALVGLLAAACCGAALAQQPLRAEVSAEDLQAKIDELVDRIRATQAADGSLGDARRGQYSVGQTALGVLALRAASVPADDPVLARAVRYLTDKRLGSRGVYEAALRMMALESVDPVAYRLEIAADAERLISWQDASGGWGYPQPSRPDNSNSQFALLGLNAAAMSGVPVPDAVWQNARRYFVVRQGNDGGWSYQSGGGSYGSMTAAGVASIYLCDLWLHVGRGQCGVYLDDRPLVAGLDWLAKNFSVTRNPRRGEWKFYYLYALERAGAILAQRYFGGYDWYREGVEHLVGDPERLVAAPSSNEWAYLRHCYMLLFLAKGNAPILIHKASWTGGWNRHRYDARFLVQFIGRELGRPFDWQTLPLGSPLDQLMAAPILYLSGGGQPFWKAAELDRLKEYVDAGGFVLVEATKGDRAFDRGFRSAMAATFPDDELEPLPRDHPIYSAYFDVPVAQRPPLEAIKGPCWISVLYAPRGLSCAWDVADFRDVSFQLGMNIVAYVTGLRKLEGKLVAPTYSLPPDARPEKRRGAFTMGQIVHAGDWRPHKVAWSKVLAQVNEKAGVDVYSRPIPIRLGADSPFEAHMLYLTGVGEVSLSEEELELLRLYVERGGFIFVEAACGSLRFDRSFRELVKRLFPEQALEEVRGGPDRSPAPSVGRAPGRRRLQPTCLRGNARTTAACAGGGRGQRAHSAGLQQIRPEQRHRRPPLLPLPLGAGAIRVANRAQSCPLRPVELKGTVSGLRCKKRGHSVFARAFRLPPGRARALFVARHSLFVSGGRGRETTQTRTVPSGGAVGFAPNARRDRDN